MPEQPEDVSPQQAMQMMQQKLGNLELTVHALLAVLEEKDMVDQDNINEKAQDIVDDMQQQQTQGHEGHDHE